MDKHWQGGFRGSEMKKPQQNDFSGYPEAYQDIFLLVSPECLTISEILLFFEIWAKAVSSLPEVWVLTLLMGREFLHRTQFTSKTNHTPLPKVGQ